ncbi:MAG TPA: hypothetical protein VM934_00130 [Pyrinomonadaceae bacterium]|nr:hypothetical protein [Pyrinomonadaceae bacterium]
MARTTKKRRQELKHDKFRDTTMDVYGRVAHRVEGRGRTIVYIVLAGLALAVGLLAYNWWRGNQADAARLALGKAIEVAEAPVVSGTPDLTQTGQTFPSERERAQKAVEEFQKVQNKYGAPYNELARYFAAVNLLTVERGKGVAELEAISKGGNDEVAARARFTLAQAREADGQLDAAAALYQELLKSKDGPVSENTINLRLAAVYEKQDKKEAAADILYRMVEASRKEQGKDGKPVQPSVTIRAADEQLQKLSPARYAQLPAKPAAAAPGGLPF